MISQSKIKKSSDSTQKRYQQAEKVALKILEKANFASDYESSEALVNEIMAHWILAQCEGVLRILSIYDNAAHVILVLEYQS